MTDTLTLPRIGIVAVTLPDDGPAMHTTWINDSTLIVGHDPRILNRHLVALILTQQIGDYVDVDAHQAIADAIDGGDRP